MKRIRRVRQPRRFSAGKPETDAEQGDSVAETENKDVLKLAAELRFLLERTPDAVRKKAVAMILQGNGKCKKDCCNYGDPDEAEFNQGER